MRRESLGRICLHAAIRTFRMLPRILWEDSGSQSLIDGSWLTIRFAGRLTLGFCMMGFDRFPVGMLVVSLCPDLGDLKRWLMTMTGSFLCRLTLPIALPCLQIQCVVPKFPLWRPITTPCSTSHVSNRFDAAKRHRAIENTQTQYKYPINTAPRQSSTIRTTQLSPLLNLRSSRGSPLHLDLAVLRLQTPRFRHHFWRAHRYL